MKRFSYIYVSLLTVMALVLGGGTAVAADPTPAPMAPTGSDTVLGHDPSKTYTCIALPVLSGQGQGQCPAGQYEISNDPNQGGAIVSYLKLFLKLFNMLVGVVVVLVIIIAGFQYITSAGDPTAAKKARGRITAAITALILYMLMVAILNFLVPGGVL